MATVPISELQYPPSLRRPDLGNRTRIRTFATVLAYRKRYFWLIQRAQKATGASKISYLDLAKFIRNLAPTIKYATYRQYCAAYNQLLRDTIDRGKIGSDEAERLANFVVVKEPAAVVFRPNSETPRTSAKRAKSISLGETSRIATKLSKSRSTSARAVSVFLFANQLLGLRPVEWLDTHIEGHVLTVKCAKFSLENGRAIAEKRTIFLPESFSPAQIEAIKETICTLKKLVVDAKGDRTKVVRHLGNVLRAVRDETSKVALRTTRHQAKSNFLANGLSHFEIAALMGHASASTAQAHYGQRSRGRKLRAVAQPDPQLVNKVRDGAWYRSKQFKCVTNQVGHSENTLAAAPKFG
ncbi:MAG: hypothetical protein ACRCT6_00880 [Notoacmeibacter sp.]